MLMFHVLNVSFQSRLANSEKGSEFQSDMLYFQRDVKNAAYDHLS